MGLFDVFRRKPHKQLPSKEQAAHEMGRSVGGQYASAMMAYVNSRCDVIEPNFLDVLQKTLDTARVQKKYSPLLVARVEYQLFLEHVDDAASKLAEETRFVLSEWDALHETIDLADYTRETVTKYVNDRFCTLKIHGLKVMTDNADILKTADDRWRAKFPKLAAQQPLDV